MNEFVCSILDERDEIELVEFRIFVAVFYRHVQLKKSKPIFKIKHVQIDELPKKEYR